MSMIHKAFAFDHQGFRRRLQPALDAALATHDPTAIRRFIDENLHELTDPYDGEPLANDWERMIETRDVQQYGDFALTAFYCPTLDRGLGEGWSETDRFVRSETGSSRLLLGARMGPHGMFFDPGRQGAYFQTHLDCCCNLDSIRSLGSSVPAALSAGLKSFGELLEEASSSGRGLYVTF